MELIAVEKQRCLSIGWARVAMCIGKPCCFLIDYTLTIPTVGQFLLLAKIANVQEKGYCQKRKMKAHSLATFLFVDVVVFFYFLIFLLS